jgi:hypothetical protein
MLAIGLDHSLTAFGLTAAHSSWELDFRRVRRAWLRTPSSDCAPARRAALARDVVRFVDHWAEYYREPLSNCRVAIEGGIAQRGRINTIRSQEGVAAVVAHELWTKLQLELELAEQTAVRSLFMGPEAARGRGAGDVAQELMRKILPPVPKWHESQLDAFLVTNYVLADEGEAFVSVAPRAA